MKRTSKKHILVRYKYLLACSFIFPVLYFLLLRTSFFRYGEINSFNVAKLKDRTSDKLPSEQGEDRTFIPKVSLEIQDFDPLEDSLTLYSYPRAPLDLTDIKACDIRSTVRLAQATEINCKQDSTCYECTSKERYRANKLRKVFFSESLVALREQFIKRNFSPKEQDIDSELPVFVASVNYGLVYLFLNLACSIEMNGFFDPRKYFYLFPTDKEAYDVLHRNGFIVEPLTWLKGAPKILSEYTGKNNAGGHALINTLLAFAGNFLLQRGYTIVLTDVDIVFKRNPFPYLNKAAKHRDVLGFLAPLTSQLGFMNSGFLYLRPTRKMKIFFQTFENLSFIKKRSDQQLWNTLLRDRRFVQLEQRLLPRYLFYILNIQENKTTFDPELTMIVHVSEHHKAARLMRINQWYFNETCPYYEEEIDNEAKSKGFYDYFNASNRKITKFPNY